MRVLVVEDNAEVRELVSRSLAKDGHLVTTAANVAAADARIADEDFDLLLLDLGLPDEDGVGFCKRLRATGFVAPILVVTARGSVHARVAGLEAGADDYMAKPFAVAELRARVRALLRRGAVDRRAVVTVDDVEIDLAARRARVDCREVPLTAREWSLLELLVARGGRVVARSEILEVVWGEDSAQSAASLDVIIARIRKKLGAGVVRTIRGEGYAIAGVSR